MCSCFNTVFRSTVSRRNHRVLRVLSRVRRVGIKSPQNIFSVAQKIPAAPSHIALLPVCVSEPTYQSLPLRRASEIHSIGTPPNRPHLVPRATARAFDQTQTLFAPRTLPDAGSGNHLKFALKDHVQRPVRVAPASPKSIGSNDRATKIFQL